MDDFIGLTGTRAHVIGTLREWASDSTLQKKSKCMFIEGAYRIGKTETIKKAIEVFDGDQIFLSQDEYEELLGKYSHSREIFGPFIKEEIGGFFFDYKNFQESQKSSLSEIFDGFSKYRKRLIIGEVDLDGNPETNIEKISLELINEFYKYKSDKTNEEIGKVYVKIIKLKKKIKQKEGSIANKITDFIKILSVIKGFEPNLSILLIVCPNENYNPIIEDILTAISESNIQVVFEIYTSEGLSLVTDKAKKRQPPRVGLAKALNKFNLEDNVKRVIPFSIDECDELLKKYRITTECNSIVDKLGCHPFFLDLFCKRILDENTDANHVAEEIVKNEDKDFRYHTEKYFNILKSCKQNLYNKYKDYCSSKKNNIESNPNDCKNMLDFALLYRNRNNVFHTPALFKKYVEKGKENVILNSTIYINYSHEDLSKVKRICERLKDNRFSTWIDEDDIYSGENQPLVIEKAIKDSTFFLCCLSNKSVDERGDIQRQINIAIDKWLEKRDDDIFLIPILLEECKIPEKLTRFKELRYFEENGFEKLILALKEGLKRYNNGV